jgi:type IV secretory pathway protease TraF
MGALWQNVLVICLVIGAAVYVGRRFWRRVTSKKPTGCWHCSDCSRPSKKKRLVSVELPPKARKP